MDRFRWTGLRLGFVVMMFFFVFPIIWTTSPPVLFCAANDGPPALGKTSSSSSSGDASSAGDDTSGGGTSSAGSTDVSNDQQPGTPVDALSRLHGQRPMIVRLKYLKPEQAKDLLTVLIPADQIRVETTNNMLIILASDDEYEQVKEMLAKVDIAPRQVMFEAEIVEVSLEDIKNTGIDWGSTTTVPSATGSTGAYRINMGPNGENFGINVQATIHHLIENKKGRVLACPRIAALDGQTASILIGDKLAVTTTEVTSGSTISSTTYVDVSIKLEVTPSVNEDGTITTHLKPEVSNETSVTSDGSPNIRIRQAETTLRVKSGETIVLGGLIQREETKNYSKIPLLGDLPLVGGFFRFADNDKKDTELIIMITPTMMNE